MTSIGLRPAVLFFSLTGVNTAASISARKLSNGTTRAIISSGSPFAVIAASRLSASKNPNCPIVPTRESCCPNSDSHKSAEVAIFRGPREIIAGLGSAAVWPVVARAQQGDRVRRIGVLMPGDENDPVQKARLSAFTQALADLGWTDGRNVRLDIRWVGADINRIRALAHELVGLQPDIIVTNTTPP